MYGLQWPEGAEASWAMRGQASEAQRQAQATVEWQAPHLTRVAG